MKYMAGHLLSQASLSTSGYKLRAQQRIRLKASHLVVIGYCREPQGWSMKICGAIVLAMTILDVVYNA